MEIRQLLQNSTTSPPASSIHTYQLTAIPDLVADTVLRQTPWPSLSRLALYPLASRRTHTRRHTSQRNRTQHFMQWRRRVVHHSLQTKQTALTLPVHTARLSLSRNGLRHWGIQTGKKECLKITGTRGREKKSKQNKIMAISFAKITATYAC